MIPTLKRCSSTKDKQYQNLFVYEILEVVRVNFSRTSITTWCLIFSVSVLIRLLPPHSPGVIYFQMDWDKLITANAICILIILSLFQPVYASVFLACFNIFPSLSILFCGIFEQDLKAETLMDHPVLYR